MNGPLFPPSPAHELRRRARQALQGRWAIAVGLTLLAALLGAEAYTNVPATINVTLPSDWLAEHKQALSSGVLQPLWVLVTRLVEHLTAFINDHQVLSDLFSALAPLVQPLAACSLIHFLVGGCVRLGLARVQLALLDGEKPSVGRLFSAFDRLFFKALLLRILRALFVFLWSLLFVLPGLVAIYRYSMADYALAENPNMSALDALRESKRMMKGNKWRLFCLRWSFIGWYLLDLLTCGIAQLWLNPYIGQADAAFYHEISGRAAIHEAVGAFDDILKDL